MTALKLMLSRMNGWALSLLLHGGVALLAGLSVFSVQMGGGRGNGAGGAAGSFGSMQSFGATIQRTGDEPQLSGTVLPDIAQFSRLTSEDDLETVTEELSTPTVPFDFFAVGSSESAPTPTPPVLTDPLASRPGSDETRGAKLPAATAGNSDQDSDGSPGSNGTLGSSDGDGDGKGNGEGTGEGNATGVYTPTPAYPSEARRRNIEGSVLVELAIATDGSCALRRILESSGFSPLDEAVEKTVAHWKYRPADADGRPDTITKRLRFTFRLGH